MDKGLRQHISHSVINAFIYFVTVVILSLAVNIYKTLIVSDIRDGSKDMRYLLEVSYIGSNFVVVVVNSLIYSFCFFILVLLCSFFGLQIKKKYSALVGLAVVLFFTMAISFRY